MFYAIAFPTATLTPEFAARGPKFSRLAVENSLGSVSVEGNAIVNPKEPTGK